MFTGRIFAVVPAAGVGRRMGHETPKQYLHLAGRPIIEHTLAALAMHPSIARIVVAVSMDDRHWSSVRPPSGVTVTRVDGGRERAASVQRALTHLLAGAGDDDWALVHDAVRPCLHRDDLEALIRAATASTQGALLAHPARDTMKRVKEGEVMETVPRESLWHAMTPQMFPLRALHAALARAEGQGINVTDESQAMELVGVTPRVVSGRVDNIKITTADDLRLAALALSGRGSPSCA